MIFHLWAVIVLSICECATRLHAHNSLYVLLFSFTFFMLASVVSSLLFPFVVYIDDNRMCISICMMLASPLILFFRNYTEQKQWQPMYSAAAAFGNAVRRYIKTKQTKRIVTKTCVCFSFLISPDCVCSELSLWRISVSSFLFSLPLTR